MKNIISILFLLISTSVFAQHTLTSRISGGDNQSTPFAVISLINADSTVNKNTIADSTGKFMFKQLNKGQYKIKAKFVGYYEYEGEFEMPDNDFTIPEIVLQQNENELDAVVVKEKRIIDKGDKKIIYPSDAIKENSNNGYTALAMLQIPGLSVDIFDNTVSSYTGQTLLCINGRAASDDEIKTLNPQDIRRIDFYKNFNPKYPTAKSVVDFIIEKPDQGGSLYINATQYLNRGTGDDVADLKLYNKNSEFNIQINGDYNHFEQSKGENTTVGMEFPNEKIIKNTTEQNSSIHGNSLGGKLSYLRYGKNDLFNVTASLRGAHNSENKSYNDFYQNLNQDFSTTNHTHNENLSPAAQLYYHRNSSKGHFFKASLYGSYNNTDYDRNYASNVDYISNTKEDYYFISPSLSYNLPISEMLQFYFDANYYYNIIKQTYTENNLSTDSKLNYGTGSFAAGTSFWVIPNKMAMNVKLEDKMLTVDNGNTTNTKHYFAPTIFWAFFTQTQMLMTGLSYGISEPAMRYYSSSQQSIDMYQILMGNSELETSKYFGAQISYVFGPLESFFQVITNDKTMYEQTTYDNSKNTYIHTYLNGGKNLQFNSKITAKLDIVQEKLQFTGGVGYDYFKEESWEKQHKHSVYGFASLMYIKNRFNTKLDFTSAKHSIEYGYILKEPYVLTLGFGYNVKQWNFMLDIKNPWLKVYNCRDYNNSNYVLTSKYYQPKVDYDVFRLSVSYRFNFGKYHNYQNIDMDNSQKSGILKTR